MQLDHVNVRTANLETMRSFFEEIVGLTNGPRPRFDFPGYWLYGGGEPIVHLVGIDAAEASPSLGPIDHIAFRGGDYEAQKAVLERNGYRYREADVPGANVRQIFIIGPEGIKIELQFPQP